MTCILLHSSGYSSVFLGAAAAASSSDQEQQEQQPGDLLSCFKVFNKAALQARHVLNVRREVCILSRLREERVYGLGGNLHQHLARSRQCFTTEQDLAVEVVIPLLHVLASLHSRGIIHRDIKPENLFFEQDGKLVVGDFGLAIDSTREQPVSRVGTHGYLAPEVLAQPTADVVALRSIPASALARYTTAVDIWAVGTLMHEALTGRLPFHHPEPAAMELKAQFGKPHRLGASAECEAFVDAALRKQASQRPTAAELLRHPWVLGHAAAAAAAVAARVKLKVLAELGLHRLADKTCASAQAPPAVVRGSCSAAAVPAQPRAGCTPAMSGSSRSGPLPPSATARAQDRLKEQQPKLLDQLHAGCHQVTEAVCVQAGGQQPVCDQQQQHRPQHSASLPGATEQAAGGAGCSCGSSTAAAGSAGRAGPDRGSTSSAQAQKAGQQQLHLLPALSEPMLLDVPSSPAKGQCSTPDQSCQPGTGSAAGAAVAPGSAASSKPLLFSPPKPAMLLQRLRSFASHGRDRTNITNNSSTAQGRLTARRGQRRHSFDVSAGALTAAQPADRAAAAAPAAASNTPAVGSCSPLRSKARPPATSAGLAPPLAALRRLSHQLLPHAQ